MNTKNKGYLGNPNLKPAHATRTYTPEQLQEMYKCATDIEYFTKYCTIVTLDGGKEIINLRGYQKDMLHTMNGSEGYIKDDKYNVVVLSPRQSGKCLTFDSEIKVKSKKDEKIIETTLGNLHNDLV